MRAIAASILLGLSFPGASLADDPEVRRLAARLESKDAEIRLLEEQIDRLTRLVRLLRYPVESAPPPVRPESFGLIGGGSVARATGPAVEGRVLGVSSQGLVRVNMGEATGLKPGHRLAVATGGTIRIIRVDARDAIGEYQSSDDRPLPAVSAVVRWFR